MVEKNHLQAKSKGGMSMESLVFKTSDTVSFPTPPIKMMDGNFSNKERKQVVMKLIQFMKTT
jgi:hypothetical protein